MAEPAGFRVGVDVGGTFTDLALIDAAGAVRAVGKLLTTPADPADAIVDGTLQLLERARVALADVEQIVHGTTRVANAIIERKGAPTALLTTEGFRDVLEIGRELRYDIYDPFMEKASPLVERRWRRPVTQRTGADGATLVELDLAGLEQTVAELEADGVEAIAVSFLHAYANDEHERRVGELLRRRELKVSLSSEVAPEIREYERTSTAVANAYVQPLMQAYLDALEQRLRAHGFAGRLFIMLSSGGLTTPTVAGRFPIQLVESGPAAGVIAARDCARAVGSEHIVSFDMGGTTAKMCLVDGGEIPRASDIEVARLHLFKKGSGLPLKVPVVEMLEIGAGGGSIASIDEMGLLKVGPRSAGAVPGPVCYRRGGEDPTVTDADAVLGYLSPAQRLGGYLEIDVEAAGRAIERSIATPLGMSVTHAAHGIHRVVNEGMARAVRVYAAEKGRDVRRCSLVAFGGAGPVHAYGVARLLGIRCIVCPARSGVASAVGFLLAPARVDLARTQLTRVDALAAGRIAELYSDLERQAGALLADAGVACEEIEVRRVVEMRYAGQGFEIPVTLPRSGPSTWTSRDLVEAFDEEYARLFDRGLPAVPIEAVTWRLTASGAGRELHGAANPEQVSGAPATRRAYFEERGDYVECAIHDRAALGPGARIDGPAIVHEPESTVVIGPSATATIDPEGNLILDLAE